MFKNLHLNLVTTVTIVSILLVGCGAPDKDPDKQPGNSPKADCAKKAGCDASQTETENTQQQQPEKTPCELAGGSCYPGLLRSCPTPADLDPSIVNPCGETDEPMTCCGAGVEETPCEKAGGKCFPGQLLCPTPAALDDDPEAAGPPCGEGTEMTMTCCAYAAPPTRTCGADSCEADEYCMSVGCGIPDCVAPEPSCQQLPPSCEDCSCIPLSSCLCEKKDGLIFVDCPGA